MRWVVLSWRSVGDWSIIELDNYYSKVAWHMPYFVFKVPAKGRPEVIDSHENYRQAKTLAKTLRTEAGAKTDRAVRIIFAGDAAEAERLLVQKREPPPLGEDG